MIPKREKFRSNRQERKSLFDFPKNNQQPRSKRKKNKMRTKRTLPFRLLLFVGLLMCPAAVVLAQGGKTDEYPKFEFFGGYSALGDANSRGLSFGNGASTSSR